MRYDKNITLLKTESNQFDYETGNSIDKLVEVGKFMANVNGVGLENEKLIFGTVGNNNLVFRIKGVVGEVFDYVMYNGKTYRVKSISTHRDEYVIYGSEK